MVQNDQQGSAIDRSGSRLDYITGAIRNEKSAPGANVAELEKLEVKLTDLKISSPGKYYALDKVLKDGTGKDGRLHDMVIGGGEGKPGRPDAVNRHVQQLIENPGDADAIIGNMERDAAGTQPPSVSANQQAPSVPPEVVMQAPGAAATAGAATGDPNAVFGAAGMETPQAGKPNAGGMQNLMSSLGNILPQLGQMLQELFGKLMGAFKDSGSLMEQGNNNTLAQRVMDMTGSDAKLTSIDPQSGRVLEPNTPKPDLERIIGMQMQRPTMG